MRMVRALGRRTIDILAAFVPTEGSDEHRM